MKRSVCASGGDLPHPPYRGSGEVTQLIWLRIAKQRLEARRLRRTKTIQDWNGGTEVGRVDGAADLGDTGKLSELVSQRGRTHSPRLTDLGVRRSPRVPRQTLACPCSFTLHPCDLRPQEMQRRNIDPSLQLML